MLSVLSEAGLQRDPFPSDASFGAASPRESIRGRRGTAEAPPLGPAVTEARTPRGAGDGGVGQGSQRPTHWTRRTERERRPPPGPSPPRAPCPSQSHAAPGEAWLLAEVAALSSLPSLRADAVAPPSPHRRRTCLLVGRKCWGH